MIKVKEFKVKKSFKTLVSLPRVFIEDNKITQGDTIEYYRTNVEGKDALVIITKKGGINEKKR